MNITLDFDEFLKVITYNDLFPSVSLFNHPKVALAILQADPEHKSSYLEHVGPDHYVLWPVNSWIAENKRRREMDELVKRTDAAKQEKQAVITLQDQLVTAILEGRQADAEILAKEIEKKQ